MIARYRNFRLVATRFRPGITTWRIVRLVPTIDGRDELEQLVSEGTTRRKTAREQLAILKKRVDRWLGLATRLDDET